jgi:magnesium transporter
MVPSSHQRQSAKSGGLAPGTAVFLGNRKVEQSSITLFHYTPDSAHEIHIEKPESLKEYRTTSEVVWINVTGVHDTRLIESIAALFGIHALTVEDIVDTTQQPKMEAFKDYVFLELKMLTWKDDDSTIEMEQVSLILGKGFVISFQEQERNVLDPLRDRIRSGRGWVRKMQSDYLAYAIMDTIVDNYFLVLDRVGEQAEALETALIEKPQPEQIQTIQHLKQNVLCLRRSLWPLREDLGRLDKDGIALVSNETKPFVRDLYDHTVQLIEAVEASREVLAGLHEIYLSSVNYRMNEIMKVLTVIATIFMPLSFIASVYGMNFQHMPELRWPWGYAMVWAVMLSSAAGMLAFFKSKKWF